VSRRVCVRVPAAVVRYIGRLRGPFSERFSAQEMIELLIDDLKLADERPGSWEGANMRQVLESHGIGEVPPDD
jgi:hypothetical protein